MNKSRWQRQLWVLSFLKPSVCVTTEELPENFSGTFIWNCKYDLIRWHQYKHQTCNWRHVSGQEYIWRQTSESSWASLAHCRLTPLVFKAYWLDWGEGELSMHERKDHSCCIQQLLSSTTCFSREPRPTEKGCQPPGVTPGDVCQPYARLAAAEK